MKKKMDQQQILEGSAQDEASTFAQDEALPFTRKLLTS